MAAITVDAPNARDQLRVETGAHLARPLSGRCGAEPRQQGACPADPSAASRCYAAWLELKVLGLQARVLRQAGQHAWSDLVVVVEGEDHIGGSGPRENLV